MAQKKRKRKKASATRRSSRRKRLPNWGLIGIGLVVGIALVYLLQFVIARTTSSDSGLRQALMNPRKPPADKRVDQAHAPRSKPQSSKPKYDFYTILPEIETVIPDSTTRETGVSGVTYVLQAASFANFSDADRLKAKLALHGLQAKIQKISIEGKGEFHRVRLGPYNNLQHLDRANQRLQQLGRQNMERPVFAFRLYGGSLPLGRRQSGSSHRMATEPTDPT